MKLDEVQIRYFRNLKTVDIVPSHRLNVVIGQNGSGKSSLLEALHYLGFGRSFRTAKHKRVVQSGENAFTVFSVSLVGSGRSKRLGISRTVNDELTVSIDGKKASKMADLVSHIPMLLFTPQSSDAVLGAPSSRRRFLDWGLFHVEHGFSKNHLTYQKLVKQKNAFLKLNTKQGGKFDRTADVNLTNGHPGHVWDTQIVKYGMVVSELREAHIERLIPIITEVLVDFLPEFSFDISYHRGWEKGLSLEEAMDKNAEKDARYGFLSVGPHKADFVVKADGIDAKELLSRGQQRMLVAALQLAQATLLKDSTEKDVVYLLDDIGAELDVVKREKFIDRLLDCNSQVFVTAIELDHIDFVKKYRDQKVFHVEHGCVTEENNSNVGTI